MSIFSMLEISGSALGAERQRAEVVASNMANAETTHTTEGGPYRRKNVVFTNSGSSFGMTLAAYHGNSPSVRLANVVDDPAPPVLRYEPGHPDANKEGYVAYPAINPIQEMVDLMGAMRAYQLNATAVSASKQMIQEALSLLR
ncbi:MAG TPA: flagellar basal body rod protein FlgC [Terriglobales bacterium]|nr:flagellar basal body rod protein FlgC [Terriglobales bacterium]